MPRSIVFENQIAYQVRLRTALSFWERRILISWALSAACFLIIRVILLKTTILDYQGPLLELGSLFLLIFISTMLIRRIFPFLQQQLGDYIMSILAEYQDLVEKMPECDPTTASRLFKLLGPKEHILATLRRA